MKLIGIVPEQFSNDSSNNYLQFLMSSAVRDGSTDIYFYPEREYLRAFRNAPNATVLDGSALKKLLPAQAYDALTQLGQARGGELEDRIVPDGFFEDMLVPIRLFGAIGDSLKSIYKLDSLDQLTDFCPMRLFNVGGKRLWTGLSLVAPEQGTGYRMRLLY